MHFLEHFLRMGTCGIVTTWPSPSSTENSASARGLIDDISLGRLKDIPIFFFSGSENTVFTPEATGILYTTLKSEFDESLYERDIFEGFGDLDCWMSEKAAEVIWTRIKQHIIKVCANSRTDTPHLGLESPSLSFQLGDITPIRLTPGVVRDESIPCTDSEQATEDPEDPPSPLLAEIKFMPDRLKEGGAPEADIPPSPSSAELHFIPDLCREGIMVELDVPPSPASCEIEFISDWRKEGVMPEPDESPSSSVEIELVSTSISSK